MKITFSNTLMDQLMELVAQENESPKEIINKSIEQYYNQKKVENDRNSELHT